MKREQIEFIGGPLDGCINEFPVPLESLVLVETIPVRERWFTTLLGLMSRAGQRTFVVAFYELQIRDEQMYYQYVHSRVANQRLFRNAKVWVLYDSEQKL